MSYFQPTARPTSTRCSSCSSTTSPVPFSSSSTVSETILDTIVVGGGAYSEEYTPTPPSSPPPLPLEPEPEHAELETEMKNTGEHDIEEEEKEDGGYNSDSDERQKQAAAGKRMQQPKKKKRQKKEMMQMTLNVSRTTDPGFTLCKDCGILYNHLNQKDRQEHSRRHAAWVRRNNKTQT
ncbi:hypothetical protein QBC46DRAFT_393410 [Diplogelasinospora grovesii]|uniref:N-acetyltransferase ESCO zinc-finger domain-containing protein n=1 Tax=Diplogelasinospora grovesii TaxID=303347 RepID=A0AAN6S1L4_9PEZI|nr:hypothetical protein QBC46DRAFT_393410 [Diplogelasinospora grovesii]